MNDTAERSEITGELRAPSRKSTEGAITTPIPGLVTHQIGSGEHAQNSIVYKTILWSFVGGALLSIAAVGIAVWRGTASPFSDIKDVWAIFAPLITLSLGYLFGKGR
jgi:hypothetical protein